MQYNEKINAFLLKEQSALLLPEDATLSSPNSYTVLAVRHVEPSDTSPSFS